MIGMPNGEYGFHWQQFGSLVSLLYQLGLESYFQNGKVIIKLIGLGKTAQFVNHLIHYAVTLTFSNDLF